MSINPVVKLGIYAMLSFFALNLVSCGGGSSATNGSGNTANGSSNTDGAATVQSYVYVADHGVAGITNSGDLSVFSVNNQSGELSRLACVSNTSVVCSTNYGYDNYTAGYYPFSLAMDPNGKFLLVSSGAGGYGVGVYALDGSTGVPTLVPCQSTGSVTCDANNGYVTVSSTNATNAMTFDPTGKYVFFINDGSGSNGDLAVFSIDSSGVLTQISCNASTGASCTGNYYTLGFNPLYAEVDPSGKYLYVAVSEDVSASTANSYVGDIAAYAISANGQLTPINCDSATGSVCNGNNFLTGYYTPNFAIDSAGKYLYADNDDTSTGTGTITELQIGSDGSLTPVPCTSNNSITCTTFTDGSNSVDSYLVGSGLGQLTFGHSGDYLYGLTSGLAVWSVTASGTLTPIPCVSGSGLTCVTDTVNTTSFSEYPISNGASSISFDHYGKYLYIANNNSSGPLSGSSGDVSAYAVSTAGKLIPITCSSTVTSACTDGGFTTGFTPYASVSTP